MDDLYAYLKGRSDGAITRAKVEPNKMNNTRRLIGSGAGAVRAACPLAARKTRTRRERTALRVCQDPNNLPFSNVQGAGIENRIAEVFGKALGLPVSTTRSRSAWPSSATRCATSCRGRTTPATS
jgi:hypothetical protein